MATAWHGSTRRQTLPHDWEHRRNAVQRRAGGRCEWTLNNGTRCTTPGTDCDHVGDRDNHTLDNLRWLCRPHHDQHTQQQLAARRARLRHPTRNHPGERRPDLGGG